MEEGRYMAGNDKEDFGRGRQAGRIIEEAGGDEGEVCKNERMYDE